MTSEVGRRAFLGSATVAGLSAAVLTLPEPARAQTHHHSSGDQEFDLIGREVARIVKQMPATAGPGPLLALASTFRLLGSAVESQNVDGQILEATKRLIATHGRAALIEHAKSPEMTERHKQLLTRHSIPYREQRLPDALYEEQLDAILSGRAIVNATAAAATALENAYRALQTPETSPGVLRAQNPYLTQIFRCAYLGQQCNYYSALSANVCSLAAIMGLAGIGMVPVCAGLGLTAGGYCYAEYHYNCY